MDEQQRQRAGRAVEAEMDRQGLDHQSLAAMSGVAPVTIRDLCSGKRWPWNVKRNQIELALNWPAGRIAQIARGNAAVVPTTSDDDEPVCDDPTHGQDMPDALTTLLKHTGELSPARQAKVVAHYLELVEDQEGLDTPPRRSGAG